MKLSILKTTDPYYNLAVEEYLLKNSTEDYFLLWQNEPTVVIGKNQNAFAEINLGFTKEKGIRVARRITGGGAVYHDLGNLNFSYISNEDCGEIDFDIYTKPIINALLEMGLPARLSGRNDILLDEKKISGNAQAHYGGRVLHHGTLLFDSELGILSSALNTDIEKLKAKAIKSTRSRVTNIKPYLNSDYSISDFIAEIKNKIAEQFSPTIIEIEKNEEIDSLAKRNASAEWLFPKKDFLSNYTFSAKKRFDFGIVSIFLDMKNEIISSAKIQGDFFGKKDVSEIEAMLVGTSIAEIKETLKNVCISDYVHTMTIDDVLDLLYNK